MAKLPKLAVFSRSKCATTSSEATPSSSALKSDRLPSKPPSRQGGDSSNVSIRRLDIRINLPNANGSIIRGEANSSGPGHGRGQEGTTRSRSEEKDKHTSTACPPQVWERGKIAEEISRTKTWPSLHYKLWLDASNLPLQYLCEDERANKPTDYLPHKRKKSSSSANSKLTAQYLSVSKPPSRQSLSSSDTRMRSGPSALRVGTENSWRVSSSYAHRESKATGGMASSPQHGGNLPRPRLPSRMGSNNLELFLKQNTDKSHSHSTTKETPIPHSKLISPRYYCNTSTEVNLLTLRTFARNPRLLQDLAAERRERENGGNGDRLATADGSKNRQIWSGRHAEEGSLERNVDGVKHVRFSVPCGAGGEGEEERMVGGERWSVRESGGCGLKQRLTDVTPPPTPPTFEQVYRIKRYTIPIHRNHSHTLTS